MPENIDPKKTDLEKTDPEKTDAEATDVETIDDYSSANVFVDNDFDRAAEKRKNPQWLENTLQREDTRVIPVWRHRCATIAQALRFAALTEFPDCTADELILLGIYKNAPVFALDIGESENLPAGFEGWKFEGLRAIGTGMPAKEAALAAFAQAMVFWIRRHRYCGHCGNATVMSEAGHVLDCSNPDCFERSFPRSDPAVIVLATDGERALLGRQADWPPGRYSTIAGFVEPGESLEAAVRREVAEETGHLSGAVTYFASQPWPFPSSLMLGFVAQVGKKPVMTPDEELEDVRWFSRDEIIERTLHGPPLLPPPLSIAFRLVEHWFDSSHAEPLARVIARRRK